MGDRIKELRKQLKLSMDAFGARVGIGKSSISMYESDQRVPAESLIKLICKEFNVNENWLRYGTGDMFEELLEEDEYTRAAMELSKTKDKFAMQMLISYWKLDDAGKKLFEDFIMDIAKKMEQD